MEIQMDSKAKMILLRKITEKQTMYLVEMASGLRRMHEIEQIMADSSPEKQLKLFAEAVNLTARAEEIQKELEKLEIAANKVNSL